MPAEPVPPFRTRWRVRGDDRSAILFRETLLVLGLTLGYSAIYAITTIIATLTAPHAPLSQTTVALNTSPAPGRPLLGLFIELRDNFFGYLVPAMFAVHMLGRDRDWSPSAQPLGARLGLDSRRWRFDLLSGTGLALLIGIPGLGFYFLARALNINMNVAAANLTEWWAIPVLILNAAANGVLEEFIVVGYLVTRLRQVGWGVVAVVAASALLRGSYHLYQGFGAFIGNAIMGVVFAIFFLLTKRLWPLVLAHTLLDVVAFLGYTLLHNHVSWL